MPWYKHAAGEAGGGIVRGVIIRPSRVTHSVFCFAADLICCLRQITSPLSASCYTHREIKYQYTQLCLTPLKTKKEIWEEASRHLAVWQWSPPALWSMAGWGKAKLLILFFFFLFFFAERHRSKWAMRWHPAVRTPQRGRESWTRLVSFWAGGFMVEGSASLWWYIFFPVIGFTSITCANCPDLLCCSMFTSSQYVYRHAAKWLCG